MGKYNKGRWVYLILFIAVVLVEVYIGLFVRDEFIRPYLGDVMIVLAIYLFVRAIRPKGLAFLSLYIFLFACFVEYMQYIGILDIVGIGSSGVAKSLAGAVFDWKDIVCYGAGCILLEISRQFQKIKQKVSEEENLFHRE